MPIDIGNKAPAFNLTDQDGNKVSLNKLKGTKFVLYFYPKDSTPGCTQESCDFRDNIKKFAKKDVQVLGISKDSAKSHLKFIEKYDLPFPLLVDEDTEVCKAFGVLKKKSMFGKSYMSIERSTFIIDEKGKIEAAWRKVKVKDHVKEVLDAIN